MCTDPRLSADKGWEGGGGESPLAGKSAEAGKSCRQAATESVDPNSASSTHCSPRLSTAESRLSTAHSAH